MKKRIGNAHPGFGIVPGNPELVLVIGNVLICSKAGEDVRDRGAAGRGFETRRRRDEIIRRHTAVTPTTNPKPIRIGQAPRHRVIDRRQIVLDIAMPPIGVNAHREFFTATG